VFALIKEKDRKKAPGKIEVKERDPRKKSKNDGTGSRGKQRKELGVPYNYNPPKTKEKRTCGSTRTRDRRYLEAKKRKLRRKLTRTSKGVRDCGLQ